MKKLNFETKAYLIKLAGNCFWYWSGFTSFLRSCQVPNELIQRYPGGAYNKYEVMSNILEDLETLGKDQILQNIVSQFYRMTSPIDDEVKDPQKAKLLLEEFRKHVGNDPIERVMAQKEKESKQIQYTQQLASFQAYQNNLARIKTEFLELLSNDATPQRNGFNLEKIFYDLLEVEKFDYRKPYKSETDQVDGYFKHKSFDYLVEIKFQEPLIKKEELALFDNKIQSRAQSTRGFFLAPNGFDLKHVATFEGHSPRLILMDGVDWINILEGKYTFSDVMDKKVDQLLKHGKIYFTVAAKL
jgi:hypothetical protein